MKTNGFVWAIIGISTALTGCAGKVEYIRPIQGSTETNTKVLTRDVDSVWSSGIPALGKQFFVINNLDKSSGLLNISYSGSPDKYIDCGQISSYVKNARGERTYNFAASSPNQVYEEMNNNGLFFIDRKMALEGRVNVIFEKIGLNQTQVTANTKYVVTRTIVTRNAVDNIPYSNSHTISFNSGGRGMFPSNINLATECISTGELEREILSIIK